MQDMNPKDRPKLIALAIGVVVALGVGVKMTMDSIVAVSPAPQAPAASPTPAVVGVAPATTGTTPTAGTASGGVAGTTATTQDASGPFTLTGNFAETNGRDPFILVPDETIAKYSVIAKEFIAPPVPIAKPAIGLPMPGGNTIQGIRKAFEGMATSKNNLNEVLNGIDNKLPPPTLKVITPAPPPYTVTGVLIGEPGGTDVAILKRNIGNEKKFVVVGDVLEGGFKVVAIESGGVRVQHPGARSVTTIIPNATRVPIPGTTDSYAPKETVRVPPTATTLPLGPVASPGASATLPPVK